MPNLTAGSAVVDITPPLGLPMAGYGNRDRAAEMVVDPLKAHAIVLADGEVKVALVCADLLGLTERVVTPIRRRLADRLGAPEGAVLFTCSHTHWGPELCNSGYLPEHLLALQSPEYLEDLKGRLADLVAQADECRVGAAAGVGSGFAPEISFNRRMVGADWRTVMNYALPREQALVAAREGNRLARHWVKGRHLGPRLSAPLPGADGLRVGPADAEVVVLRLEHADGSPLCALTNFACHAVCGDDNFYGWSADYPGPARAAFEALIGAPMAFCPGCSGDQVPRWRGGATRQRVGKSLGGAAAHVWLGIDECRQELPLAAARKRVTLPLNERLPGLAEARARLAGHPSPQGSGAEMDRATLALVEEIAGMEGYEVEVWAMRLGDLGLVGLPGEILTEIGLQIKQRSPLPHTMVASQANGYLGYVPTDHAIHEGGYEPGWSPVGEGSERALVEAALELLGSLAQGG